MGKSSGSAEKSKNRLRKHQEKHESEREKMRDDAVVEVSMNSVLDLRPEDEDREELPPVDKGKGKAGVEVPVNGDLDEDSGENSEVEEQERRFAEKKRKGKGKVKDQGAVKPFAQRDLVSLAFAGDKVVQVCSVPRYFTQIVIPHFFVHRTSKKPNTERSSKMHQRKWTQHYLDGCALFPIFLILSTSSLSSRFRAHGVGLVRKKHNRNHSLSGRSPASIPVLGKTMGKHTLSSLKNETRRPQSTWSKTFHTPTRARHSMRGACRRRSGRNGTRGSGSREGHCQGWSRRCIS